MVKYLSSRPAECNFNLELEIEKLCDRLFDSNSEHSEPVSAVPTSSSACLPTLESELDSFVDSSNDEVLNSSMVVRSELQLFNSTGQRGKYLEMAYQALLTIKPSTVDGERIFSSAGFLTSRLRTRLSDNLVDRIIFTKVYLQQKRFMARK